MLAPCSGPLVRLQHSTLLPATGQCTVAPHVSQHPHGPVGQPHVEAWRGLLGQPLFSGGKNKDKLLLGPAVWSRDILWDFGKAKPPAFGCWWGLSAAHHPPPTKCHLLGRDQDRQRRTQGSSEALSKNVSVKGLTEPS